MERKLGLEIGWTPHSPRSGFASELTAAGVPFVEIRERGRWLAGTSLRTYIDVVSSASIAVSLRLSGLAAAIAYSQANFLHFFPGARPFCREALQDGKEGFLEGAGRTHVSSLGGGVGAEASGLPADLAEADAGVESGTEGAAGSAAAREIGTRPTPGFERPSGPGRGRLASPKKKRADSTRASSPVAGGRGRGRGCRYA